MKILKVRNLFMNNILRKDSISPAACIAAIVVVLSLALYVSRVGAESVLTVNCRTSSATTSPSFLTTSGTVFGAAATTTCETAITDITDLTIHLVASSSATTLHWKYEFNNSTSDNTSLWAGEDLAQVSSPTTVSHASTTVDHTWQPGDANNLTRIKNVKVDPISSRQMRLIFSVTGANAAVWFEASQKSSFSR